MDVFTFRVHQFWPSSMTRISNTVRQKNKQKTSKFSFIQYKNCKIWTKSESMIADFLSNSCWFGTKWPITYAIHWGYRIQWRELHDRRECIKAVLSSNQACLWVKHVLSHWVWEADISYWMLIPFCVVGEILVFKSD